MKTVEDYFNDDGKTGFIVEKNNIEENDDVLIFEQPLEDIVEPEVQDAPIIEEPETTETTSESEETASITEPLEVEVLEDLTPSVTVNEEELKAESDDEEEVVTITKEKTIKEFIDLLNTPVA